MSAKPHLKLNRSLIILLGVLIALVLLMSTTREPTSTYLSPAHQIEEPASQKSPDAEVMFQIPSIDHIFEVLSTLKISIR